MPSDDIMSGEEIRACLERAEAASAAPLSNAEYRDKYGEAWRLVETDVPRLARTALALESQLAHALKLEQRAIDAREELISELRERLAKKGIEEQAAYKAIRAERDRLAERLGEVVSVCNRANKMMCGEMIVYVSDIRAAVKDAAKGGEHG